MKVLQINAIYEKYSTGRITMELHETLLSWGIESYVASPKLNGLKNNCYLIGSNIDHKIHAILSRVLGKQAYYSKQATLDLLDYIGQLKPDIVHLHNLHSNYVNLSLLFNYLIDNKIATVITLHDCWFYTGKCVYYCKYGCKKWLEKCGDCPALHDGNNSLFFDKSSEMLLDKKRMYLKFDRLAVIGVSKWITEDARKSIIGNANIIKCVYNWIDLSLFSPLAKSDFKDKYGLKKKLIILGVAAEWNENKGINIFAEISKKIDERYKVVLVGECKTNYPNILQLGEIDDLKELAKIYAEADVFVNPSIQETFGKTTAEAMSCGVPVIAYNSTATPELVGRNNECGYLVEKNDSNEYLRCIKSIEKHREIMSINCRKRAEMLFLKEKNIQAYIKIYEELLLK